MTSESKANANRKNALRSTGPMTATGLRHSSMNAVRHGLSAKTMVIRGESASEFEAIHKELIDAQAGRCD